MTSSTTSSQFRLPLVATALADAVLIVVFATVGRMSHAEGITLLGVADTAWPFLAGAAVGWSLLYVYARVGSSDWFGARSFRPERVIPFGVAVWLFTVVVGMVLRRVSHQGTATSFIIVATIVLGLFLLGWRILASRLYQLSKR
ncbi:DUF3054 domain-containing protein [Gordonia sp. X0973]|uniref:DUF3054 domain-containing protein n=1 Tax=Gordonia sp. X0973 TaxID=2742602 RepID=UPI000F52A640|nr:DUF3054 domain-containing protein [Gordonia sp. X0973]QKT08898.1 DUF3054 domain-containing protein [Gordonia sp. X0973]